MVGTVIVVAQQKGGAGKTTLAAHLAAVWANERLSVGAVDIDPQGSLGGWCAARDAAVRARGAVTLIQVSGWRAEVAVGRARDSHDVVVVDCPPHGETAPKLAVRGADLVLVPVQPSPVDLWAARATLDLVAAERAPALVVMNRVPPRGRLVDDMAARIADLGHPLARTTLGNRQAFARAMIAGLGVTEIAGGGRAAAEIRALAGEVRRRAAAAS